MTIELTPNPPRPSSCAPDGVHPEARSRFVEPANGGGKREQRSGSHVNSLPKPLMIHDWYAWCGALHLRRRAANFSDGDRSPSVTLTLHSTAGDPATLRAGPPASSSAARSRSMTFSRPTPSSARSTTKIDKGVAEAGHAAVRGANGRTCILTPGRMLPKGPPKKRALCPVAARSSGVRKGAHVRGPLLGDGLPIGDAALQNYSGLAQDGASSFCYCGCLLRGDGPCGGASSSPS